VLKLEIRTQKKLHIKTELL